MLYIPFSNRYAALGEAFYSKTSPTPVEQPALVKFNEGLAAELGISVDKLGPDEIAEYFSGNRLPDGAVPLAMAYAGHQFGQYNPQLGDGRAILLGDGHTPTGEHFYVHLKGSGQTVFSRGGDGRSALGPVLREYLVSEAMAKLGVPTTRALAAVTTGEQVARDQLLPGGVITRVAKSFVRVGTFQYIAAEGGQQAVQQLADYVIERNYPQAANAANTYVALFQHIVDRQAALIAQWMQLGFIHGVMNTDNMSIAGETIDYGPCAFMDDYDHAQVYSFIDRGGRYAYNNQPGIGLWNLTRLAETLLPLFADETEAAVEIAQDVLKTYISTYESQWLDGMRSKLGLTTENKNYTDADDKSLVEDLLNIMANNEADFTLTFHYLSQLNSDATDNDETIRSLFKADADITSWLSVWRKRLVSETRNDAQRQAAMQSVNPVYIPRNHQIEAAIRAAEDNNDFSVFHELHTVLQKPYERQAGRDKYMLPPEPDEVVTQTFCGT